MPANFSFCNEVVVFGKSYLLKTGLQCILCFSGN
jgi:hypothetical protein